LHFQLRSELAEALQALTKPATQATR